MHAVTYMVRFLLSLANCNTIYEAGSKSKDKQLFADRFAT